jgi:hypothetical protein
MSRKRAETMIPKPVPFGSPGIRTIPKTAKVVTMKVEANENGENVGPLFFDDKKLEGRWFSESEGKMMAKMVGAQFVPDPAVALKS